MSRTPRVPFPMRFVRTLRGGGRRLGPALFLAFALGAPAAGLARNIPDAEGYGYAAAPQPAGPAEVLSRGIDRLTGFLTGTHEPAPEAVAAFFAGEIAPHFDFASMAAWAAGPYHRRLDADQRARLADRLQPLFLGALARNLGSFSRPLPRIDVYEPRPGRSADEAVVAARVLYASGFATRLEFRFYWSGSAWRMFDVAANGASAAAYYRRYFADLLRHRGPDALLE